jgi:hypothetical protein
VSVCVNILYDLGQEMVGRDITYEVALSEDVHRCEFKTRSISLYVISQFSEEELVLFLEIRRVKIRALHCRTLLPYFEDRPRR